jgi:N-acetylmuramoyl-L-alanine amidase
VAIEVTGEFRYQSGELPNPPRVFYDIPDSRQDVVDGPEHAIDVNDGLVKRIRLGQFRRTVTRIVIDLDGDVSVSVSQLSNPDRLVVEVRKKESKPSLSKQRKLSVPQQRASSAAARKPRPGSASTVLPAAVRRAAVKPPPAPPAAPPAKKEPEQIAKATPPPAKTPTAVKPEEKPESKRAAAAPPPPAAKKPEVTVPPASSAAPPAKKEPEQIAKATPPPVAKNPPPPVPAVVQKRPAAAPVPEKPSIQPEDATPEPPAAPPEPELVATPAKTNRAGGHSLTRVLGLKLGRVVIDPGHGGRDTGTIGPTGLREKEITLDVSKRLAKLIEKRMGSEVILTRQRDESLKLRQRTEKANSSQADLFISIHVNASRYRTVNGVETFYLNFTRSRADLEVAARENAGSDMPMHELSNLVQKIALDDKIQESRDLASSVQSSVYRAHRKYYSKARDRGVKKAPFVVLIGAQMPSILVELGFISNPLEEKLMKRDDYRQDLAEGLFQGISKYAQSLSHFQVAQANDGEDE